MSNQPTQVVDLATLVAIFAKGLSEAGITVVSSTGSVQQPQAAAPARRQSRPSTTSRASAPASPVSKSQHRGCYEVAFGIKADGTLSTAQQNIARNWFLENFDYDLKGRTVTMRSIRTAIQDVNASIRGENASTIRYWAVWNAPKGRLTDYEARLLMRR